MRLHGQPVMKRRSRPPTLTSIGVPASGMGRCGCAFAPGRGDTGMRIRIAARPVAGRSHGADWTRASIQWRCVPAACQSNRNPPRYAGQTGSQVILAANCAGSIRRSPWRRGLASSISWLWPCRQGRGSAPGREAMLVAAAPSSTRFSGCPAPTRPHHPKPARAQWLATFSGTAPGLGHAERTARPEADAQALAGFHSVRRCPSRLKSSCCRLATVADLETAPNRSQATGMLGGNFRRRMEFCRWPQRLFPGGVWRSIALSCSRRSGTGAGSGAI